MKTIIKSAITILTGIVVTSNGFTQTINWQSLKKEDKHLISINSGYDYALVYGAGYGYQIGSAVPAVLNLEYSFPSGKNVTDDFKSKIGGKIQIV